LCGTTAGGVGLIFAVKVDFGKAADDYGKHRAGFPNSFFESLEENRFIVGGETVVDLGTGTGSIARGLSKMGCTVTGVDPSPALLEVARRLAEGEGLQIDWLDGTAENTGLSDRSVDVVTAGQCWHWFDAAKAIKEVRRILKPGARLIVSHFDWLPTPENVVWHTEQLIREVNPEWNMGGGVGIYPDWFRHFAEGGFENIASYSYDEMVSYSHEGWRGRIRASAGIKGSLPVDAVADFDRRHGEMLKKLFPDDPLDIPHRVFVISGTI